MKRIKFLLPIIATALAIIIFALSIGSLYAAADNAYIAFRDRDGLFAGLSVSLELYDDDDDYSLGATVSAGAHTTPVFTYGDRYRNHYSYDHYDRYHRGASDIMTGYSFTVPEDEQKTVTIGGDTHQSVVQYPDGTVETHTYYDPYYEVGRVYISRTLYRGVQTISSELIFESEPMLLEAKDGLKIFVGGGSNTEPYTPAYIELDTGSGNKTRISRISQSNTFWTDEGGNVWFLDSLEETYFTDCSLHHFRKTGDGADDYEYKKLADIKFEQKRRILDYRVYTDTSLIVSEDEAGVRYIYTCDHTTGELYEICSFNEKAVDTVAIDHSNGVACVRFANTEYFYYMENTRSMHTSDIYYIAVDLTSHKLCAKGEIKGYKVENVFGNTFYQTDGKLMDILWKDGRLYVIDLACAHTVSPTDISNVPIISVMDENGPILMAHRFLSADLPENGGQDMVIRFSLEG